MILKKLFRPKSLALVGGYWADFVYDGNKTIGYKGKVWHINPSRKSSKTKKYYKNIKDLPEVPDCVYLAVSRDQTVKLIKEISKGNLIIVTPGIRPENYKKQDDQKRFMTPKEAMSNGADYIVIGRPITQSSDPLKEIKEINSTIE